MRQQQKKIFQLIGGVLLLVWAVSPLQAENIYATFNVQADRSANLAFTTTGIVRHVDVDIADRVQEGQKLAELENSDLKSAAAVAEAILNSARVALKFAKRAYERENKVKKLISESQHDKVIQSYETAQSRIAQMEANLAYQKALLDKTILHAPFDGIVYCKDIEVGDAVSGAMIRTVFKVQNIDRVKLILAFDQKHWQSVKVGQRFEYHVDGDPKKHQGKITKVYSYADSANRKIKAEVIAEGFLPGLFGDGYILADETKK